MIALFKLSFSLLASKSTSCTIFVISVKGCTPLSTPYKGDITPEICKTKPLHGQKCAYKCSPGYKQIGPVSSTCDNGDWTQVGFYCLGKFRLFTSLEQIFCEKYYLLRHRKKICPIVMCQILSHLYRGHFYAWVESSEEREIMRSAGVWLIEGKSISVFLPISHILLLFLLKEPLRRREWQKHLLKNLRARFYVARKQCHMRKCVRLHNSSQKIWCAFKGKRRSPSQTLSLYSYLCCPRFNAPSSFNFLSFLT